MSIHTKTIFISVWMSALLGASIGVSIQQVYCYCVGKTRVTLFVAEDACQDAPLAPRSEACCKKEETPARPQCCDRPAEQEHKGCTKKTTTVLQLKTAFEVGHFSLKKLDAPKNSFFAPPHFTPLESVCLKSSATFCRLDRPPPPPPSGRMICIRHGISRC